ncbi:pimeloyl-ACP methyl ester carboxylesterase [Nocardioides cavernae]|uniref:Pimeloyl-ACP methyl ester carboxylesterase n=1 Tax=Nocardioides cavernae TaxID=1921566 RepID=A0A7Y9GZW6_9ACTN|nr:alpha/beta fold hydrolase [Nocardioides cavernae]NYE35086.1 pimeloyl-ACP methyl ester carboxylesterase [Nocardioides cavernae]
MTDPLLTPYDSAAAASHGGLRSVVLVLHGGKPRSQQVVGGRSASLRRAAWLARAVAPRLGEAGAGVRLLRYRERGWNGGTDRTDDARWALDLVRAEHGDVPVVLLGHSMGARVAVHVADHPSVRGVVGLAPWWSGQDPVHTLAGRTLRAAHGRRDRITSFRETTAYVARAAAVADSARLRDMGALGHYMLTGASAWHSVATESVLEVLGDASDRPGRSGHAGTDGRTGG